MMELIGGPIWRIMNLERKSTSLGMGAEYRFKDSKEFEGMYPFWKNGFFNLLIR